jgi:hypothetical protein
MGDGDPPACAAHTRSHLNGPESSSRRDVRTSEATTSSTPTLQGCVPHGKLRRMLVTGVCRGPVCRDAPPPHTCSAQVAGGVPLPLALASMASVLLPTTHLLRRKGRNSMPICPHAPVTK